MRQWTDEERKRQAELIRNWQPWKHSTGATTPEGKAVSSKNALKHGAYTQEMKELMRAMTAQNKMLETIGE